jgi:hypothetical protein
MVAWEKARVACVLEGGDVESTLGFQTRREVLVQMISRYQKASIAQKGALLDEIAAITGYARRYAMWLLNHPEEMQLSPRHRRRQRTFGPEVQHALFVAWQAANQICTKRLMPYLPTLIEALERQGHLHLTISGRSQLLSMSAATADRLLRGPRAHGPRGLATTRAGTLLKQQISIRTFQQWNETQPGFLEADLVAHCGPRTEGSFLSTLTLTDIATGWTECFPLLTKSAEAVVFALQQAQACFPFPILGLDTDNGCEFINECLLAFCDAEQITFTRGREGLKNDQCFVEQKNGAVVRQVIGYDRFEGEGAYQQLGEVYQALRLYINGFQPSMKLLAKQCDGKKMRRIYDPAKTPLQRLLLSHVLPEAKEQELQREAQVLDPLRLFRHLQDLLQALMGLRTSVVATSASPATLLPFCIERCIGTSGQSSSETGKAARPQHQLQTGNPAPAEKKQQEHDAHRETPLRPQAKAHPSQAAASQMPGEANLHVSQPVMQAHAVDSPRPVTEEQEVPSQAVTEMPEVCSPSAMTNDGMAHQDRTMLSHEPALPSNDAVSFQPSPERTLAQAIQDFLEDQRRLHRRPKTLEWHVQALGLFQRYLLTEHQCTRLDQITGVQVRGWFAALAQMPTAIGTVRSPNTVESYTRSARAFCQWLVQHHALSATPFADLLLPPVASRWPLPLSPEEWEQLLLACHPPKETGAIANQAAARNRAILWILFETGMHATDYVG